MAPAWLTTTRHGTAGRLVAHGGLHVIPEVLGGHWAVRLAGVHHLKLPVRDLARSEAWYGRTLGYLRTAEFRDGETLKGILYQPSSRWAAARLPVGSWSSRGRCRIRLLLHRRARPRHARCAGRAPGRPWRAAWRRSPDGPWLDPAILHDPDGHEARFYTVEHHTSTSWCDLKRVDGAAGLARARQRVDRPASTIGSADTAPGRCGALEMSIKALGAGLDGPERWCTGGVRITVGPFKGEALPRRDHARDLHVGGSHDPRRSRSLARIRHPGGRSRSSGVPLSTTRLPRRHPGSGQPSRPGATPLRRRCIVRVARSCQSMPEAGGDLLAARVGSCRFEGWGAKARPPPCTPPLGPVAVWRAVRSSPPRRTPPISQPVSGAGGTRHLLSIAEPD